MQSGPNTLLFNWTRLRQGCPQDAASRAQNAEILAAIPVVHTTVIAVAISVEGLSAARAGTASRDSASAGFPTLLAPRVSPPPLQ